jgi:hypothetical protein
VASSIVQGVKLYNFKKLPASNMAKRKETIIDKGHEIPMNASQLSGICRHYRIP